MDSKKIIKEAIVFYKKNKSLVEYEFIKELYINSYFSPIIKIKKEEIPFNYLRLEIVLHDTFYNNNPYPLISSLYTEDDKIVIRIIENEIIKSIRETYIKSLEKKERK